VVFYLYIAVVSTELKDFAVVMWPLVLNLLCVSIFVIAGKEGTQVLTICGGSRAATG
jgi:hypothetical protein